MFNCIDDIHMWCQRIIPTVYDDSLSYLQSVYRLKGIVKEMIQAVDVLGKSNKELTKKYDDTMKELNKLQKTIDDFIKGYTIPDGSITVNKLADDVKEMLECLVQDTVYKVAKFVWFGLSDDGYFIAIIPESWKDIDFSTNEEGCLILEY